MPAVIFKASDYYGIMAEECRLTIVGKFLRTRPQIERIRSKFAEKVIVKGNVKIGYRRSIEIEGQYVKQIVGPIVTPLSMDLATDHTTRPSMAKVMVEVDLTKPKLESVFVGQEYETNPLKSFTQKLEYENVPKYYRHCKLLGHSILQCRKFIKLPDGYENNKGKNITDDKDTNSNQIEGGKETRQTTCKNLEKIQQKSEEKEQTLAKIL
ncbi:uncharacterized protein [Nicotiana tomentosiformis]|uniref:uncharacterized protein n=1 Tax=Nicotiana tomentosiformis TaxID=4098 RepID=UPI00051B33CC|nr:uncharacterized protein LOC104107231 [Nicotiana tomentosiformis]